VSTVITLQSGRPENRDSVPGGSGNSPFRHRAQTGPGTNQGGHGVTLTTCLYVVLKVTRELCLHKLCCSVSPFILTILLPRKLPIRTDCECFVVSCLTYSSSLRKWTRYASPKRWWTSTELHAYTNHMILLLRNVCRLIQNDLNGREGVELVISPQKYNFAYLITSQDYWLSSRTRLSSS
jgi:hypothetical protein